MSKPINGIDEQWPHTCMAREMHVTGALKQGRFGGTLDGLIDGRSVDPS